MEKEREVVMNVDVDEFKSPKNVRGQLGKICNNCGGYGFTLSFNSPSHSQGCNRCDQTGVEPMSNKDIQQQLIKVSQDLYDLKMIILKNMDEPVQEQKQNV